MMRPGDKLESYRLLARALERIAHLPWTIAVAGDGPCRQEVVAEFARLDPARLEWLGERQAADMPSIYGSGAIYAWPGYGEAYGLAYLEAQAAGLPVVAQDMDGVPGVVRNGETAILTPAGDMAAFADAIATVARRRRAAAVDVAGGAALRARGAILRRRVGPAGVDPRGYRGRAAMADDPTWRPLSAELDRWKRAGRVAELWLRDDDAVQPTAALDRLLDLTARHAIPALLAVIPAHAGEPLAARLAPEPGIAVAVHGWAHENHAPDGEKKQELGPHRAGRFVLGELARAKAVIDRLFAGQAAARARAALEPDRRRPVASARRNRLRRAVGVRQGEAGRDPDRQHACRHHRLARRARRQGPWRPGAGACGGAALAA